MNKKTAAFFILKEAKRYKKRKIRKRQEIYLKPFKEQKKPWADVAIDYSVNFIEALDNILTNYKNSCLDIIQNNKRLFKQDSQIKKAQNYRTNEYLDEKYNHVIVDDIKDKLLELNNSFSNALNEAYEKHIIKGSLSDATGLVFKGMGMDFDFNKYDETTRDYLKDKKSNWAKNVADTTQRGIKNQLVDGYEKGLSSYDIALNINRSSNFEFSRCETIARTEIMSSCNYADYIAFMENPNVIGLRWSSSGDKKTRAAHKAADGQKRKKVEKDNHYELEKPFIVGSSKLKYPGDNSLGAEAKELVRCRCTLYPVFKDEDLESNTIYDYGYTNNTEWLGNQTDIFQMEYLGGKSKQYLFKRGFLDEKDFKTPWYKIKNDIIKKASMNFNSMNIRGFPKEFLNYIIEALVYGLDEMKENLFTLDILTKSEKYPRIKSKDEGAVEISDDHEKFLKNELDDIKVLNNSIALIHNHPNGSPISENDLKIFFKYRSVKYIVAVGSNGAVYIVEKTSSKKVDFEEFEKKLQHEYIKQLKKLKLSKNNQSFNFNDGIKAKSEALKEIAKKEKLFNYYVKGI